MRVRGGRPADRPAACRSRGKMRRGLSLLEMLLATVVGVASGCYIYRPLLDPPAPQPPQPPRQEEGGAARPSAKDEA